MKVIRNKNKEELKAQAATGTAIDNESKILGLYEEVIGPGYNCGR